MSTTEMFDRLAAMPVLAKGTVNLTIPSRPRAKLVKTPPSSRRLVVSYDDAGHRILPLEDRSFMFRV